MHTAGRKKEEIRVPRLYAVIFFLVLLPAGVAWPAVPLASGAGTFVFTDPNLGLTKPITVWYYSPGLTADTPVVFVMHSTQRNGRTCRDAWIPYARQGSFLLLAPEFSEKYYPGPEQYNLGNMVAARGRAVDQSQWTFAAIERVFDAVRDGNGLHAQKYSIYGHSAGAQFVHRLVLFTPGARIQTAVASNAGWYTMPDFNKPFPYGLAGCASDRTGLAGAFTRRLVILLGAEDTDPEHKGLRRTAEAMAQGRHRLERGEKFFAAARDTAETFSVPFNWELKKVSGAGHSSPAIVSEAAQIILDDFRSVSHK